MRLILAKCSFSARSHTGMVRTNNEDNLYCDGVYLTPETRDMPFSLDGGVDVPCLFAVCDGMGGEANGELASLVVASSLGKHARNLKTAVMTGNLDEAVQMFISDVNGRMCEVMRSRAVRMGTTLALAVITGEVVKAYNIGDSRIYALQDRIFSRLTEDHTLAVQKVKMGLLTAGEAERSRDRHVLTRCIGVFEDEMVLTPDTLPPLRTDKAFRLLLCSDGLTDMLTDAQIESVMRTAQDVSSVANVLVDKALKNGGKDNVTCIAVEGGGGEGS